MLSRWTCTGSGHGRGWAGIAPGNGILPTGIEHGRPGDFGSNPNVTNSITLWFDRHTTGLGWLPSIDSTTNWDALIAALNANGAADPAYPGGTPPAFQNWPNNWTNTHQPETVYAIQSIDLDSTSGTYKVVVDWLVGWSSYQNINKFVWSLNSPFTTTTTVTTSPGTAPAGTGCNEYGKTGNSNLGLVPGSVQAEDWAGFNSSNTIEFDSQNITYIDVSVTNYVSSNVTTWLEDLRVGVSAGTPYNLSIQADEVGSGVYTAGTESVYTVVSVDSIATSSNGGSYYRIYLSWDFGVFDLSYHAVRICYYSMPLSASAGSDNASLSDYETALVNITASFSEDSKGWTSFKSWLQECGASLNDKYFTFNQGELYQHHSNETRNNFYGAQYNSWVCAIFNDMPSSVKSFSSLSYEGSQSQVILISAILS